MPSAEEKARRKLLAQQLQVKTRDSFLAALPMQPALLKKLFDYLDEKLVAECNDTLRLTAQFAEENAIPFQSLKEWLGEQGGYCDCEVLANVEEKFEGLL